MAPRAQEPLFQGRVPSVIDHFREKPDDDHPCSGPGVTESGRGRILGLLVERRLGRLRLFVNGENLTAVRQTRWDPLLRPTQAADRRWTVDAWALLEGRNINGGVRVRF